MNGHAARRILTLHLGILVLLFLAQFALPDYHHTNVARIMVLAAYALGYNILLGYAGLTPEPDHHPLGPHVQIGWRFARRAWGRGYATEAASAALEDAFRRAGLSEVLSYTAADNLRSQAVMARLGLRRDKSRDFTLNGWRGMVWLARPA